MSQPEIESSTFFLFPNLPPELQHEILLHCSQNDLVCLSLTSRAFRAMTLPLIPPKPSLTSVDQLLPPDNRQRHQICPHQNSSPIAKSQTYVNVACDARAHRQRRHGYRDYRLSFHAACICWACREYPPDHAVCDRPRCKSHCACISCPLYQRLRQWMKGTEDWRYCSKCAKFTMRTANNKKKYGGRCMHGRTKVRKAPNNFWTAKKGRSWGDRWWRRWGTSGINHEAYEPKPV